MQSASALPIPGAETYTAHSTAGPAVQSNEVYPTPCTTVPSTSFSSASEKRHSMEGILGDLEARSAGAADGEIFNFKLAACRSVGDLLGFVGQ